MKIISFDGGGFLGLASAAFVQEMERHHGRFFRDEFDLYCGTSTGSIIALGLAAELPGKDVCAFYREHGPIIFMGPRRRWTQLWRAKYSNRRLIHALREIFGDRTLGDIREAGKRVLVTAFNVSTGAPRIFKTDHSSQLSKDNSLPLWQVAAASSAAPTYFPMVAIENSADKTRSVFCDGGVAANHPALLGYVEAISELGASPTSTRVLSVSTPRKYLGRSGIALDSGILSWAKHLPPILFDSGSLIAHQLLLRLVAACPSPRPTYHRVHLENPHDIQIDRVDSEAIEILTRLGVEAAGEAEHRAAIAKMLDSD